MKNFLLLVVTAILSFSVMAYKEETRTICYEKAAQAVKAQSQTKYDKDGIETVSCIKHQNRYVVTCDVAASKGDGAATDSYYVILNNKCAEVLRVELTGEE